MRHGLFEGFLTRYALPDDARDFLKSVDNPYSLSGGTEDMFGTGVKFIIVNETDISANIFVFAGKDDGEFCLVFNGGIHEATSDANDAEFVEEWVVGDER